MAALWVACPRNPRPLGKGDVRDLGAAEQPGEGSERRCALRTARVNLHQPRKH